MFCAACCLCVPEMVIAVFSTGRRASQMLLEQVLSMIRTYQENDPLCAVKVVKSNMESVWLKSPGGDIRKVSDWWPNGFVPNVWSVSSFDTVHVSRCRRILAKLRGGAVHARARGWVGAGAKDACAYYMCM